MHRYRIGSRPCIVLVAALTATLPARAQSEAQAAATLMAKLTLSLTRFTQWPPGPTDALRICVAGRDLAVSQAFAETDGQVVNGRRIQVVKSPPTSGCQVLFVHSSADRVPDLVRTASSGPVLVVGNVEGTLALGGMVEFVPLNDAIRFDVNMAAVRRAQLTLSSQVLKLARQVRE